jgi:pSer/pThr/pTyr-binding forkhead associated (FHA) protein
MEQSYGKLVVIQENAPELEFEMGKASVSIGRAMTNDVILNDGRVSRSHAQLECSPSHCRLVDLKSANGTRVNGLQVEQADLKPGDIISIGSTQIRFETSFPVEEAGMTVIDTEAQLDHTIDQEILPVTINETGIPQLVIITNEGTWNVSLDDVDAVTIGRTEDNGVIIDRPKVSRKHAEVVRKGNLFVLRDLGSTNGTWFRGDQVDELILQDGDTFKIGPAQVVFKSGFGAEALTMADEILAKTPSRRTVVFVPGMMGSELWLGNERIWPNVKILFKNPEIFRYPSSVPLEPRGIVDQVIIVPNLIKIDQYNRLGDYLVEDLGYQRGVDFHEFAYDWRQDVRVSARQLGQFIESLPDQEPVTLLGHSLGTMVSRYYIERLGGDRRVAQVVLMGGPHFGVVKALTSLLVAPELLPFGLMGERMRQVISTFPSSYQIIPVYPCAVDQNGREINFLEDESWVEEAHLPLLRGGRQFRAELASKPKIPAVSVFGYGLKTTSSISLVRDEGGKFKDITYRSEPSGDNTILEKSTILPGTEIHPVQQHHGSLFVDNDVKMRLKLELAREFLK